jgi:hypothetical protein
MTSILKHVLAYLALVQAENDFKFIFATNQDDVRSVKIEGILNEIKNETPDFVYQKVKCNYH